MKTVQNLAMRAMAAFRTKRTCSWIFCNGHTQCIPFDPKIMFSAFSEFRFRHENGAKIGREGRSHDFWTEKNYNWIFTTDTPNPSLLTQNSCLARFRSVGSGTKTVRKLAGRTVLTTFGAKILTVEVFATDAPNRTLLTQNSCLARFSSSGSSTKNFVKIGLEGRSNLFGAKKIKVQFFATDAPNPSVLTQNSCLARF